MRLADLHARKRRETVELALNAVLRKLKEPVGTAEIVGAIRDLLDTKEGNLIARTLVDIAPTHPNAEQTGETFERFGRIMRRWQWTPAVKKARPKGESPEAIERRRQAQRAAEAADDQWTITPDDPGFLEDDDNDHS